MKKKTSYKKRKFTNWLNTVSAKGFKTPKKRNDFLKYAKSRYNKIGKITKTSKKRKQNSTYGFRFTVKHK